MTAEVTPAEREQLADERERIKQEFLTPADRRPASSARGVHHTALISSDVRRTCAFYQDVLGFPLVEMFENRDLPGSTHFFFDLGHGNTIAFFDLPGVDPGPYAEVLGGLHHLAISITPENWRAARTRLDAAGVDYMLESGSSIYFRDPDGARLELIHDPLGEMYGHKIELGD
jgi:catechol 2,3-dioxygenase-like lactoylglutathione lyase family enzyme